MTTLKKLSSSGRPQSRSEMESHESHESPAASRAHPRGDFPPTSSRQTKSNSLPPRSQVGSITSTDLRQIPPPAPSQVLPPPPPKLKTYGWDGDELHTPEIVEQVGTIVGFPIAAKTGKSLANMLESIEPEPRNELLKLLGPFEESSRFHRQTLFELLVPLGTHMLPVASVLCQRGLDAEDGEEILQELKDFDPADLQALASAAIDAAKVSTAYPARLLRECAVLRSVKDRCEVLSEAKHAVEKGVVSPELILPVVGSLASWRCKSESSPSIKKGVERFLDCRPESTEKNAAMFLEFLGTPLAIELIAHLGTLGDDAYAEFQKNLKAMNVLPRYRGRAAGILSRVGPVAMTLWEAAPESLKGSVDDEKIRWMEAAWRLPPDAEDIAAVQAFIKGRWSGEPDAVKAYLDEAEERLGNGWSGNSDAVKADLDNSETRLGNYWSLKQFVTSSASKAGLAFHELQPKLHPLAPLPWEELDKNKVAPTFPCLVKIMESLKSVSPDVQAEVTGLLGQLAHDHLYWEDYAKLSEWLCKMDPELRTKLAGLAKSGTQPPTLEQTLMARICEWDEPSPTSIWRELVENSLKDDGTLKDCEPWNSIRDFHSYKSILMAFDWNKKLPEPTSMTDPETPVQVSIVDEGAGVTP